MNPDTTSAIRDIFLMLAAGVFAALCLAIIAVIAKLYRPLRETAHNSARTAENLSRITGDIASVSEETAGNIAQTARNAVEISENLKAVTADLPNVVQSVGEAANSLASVSDTATRITRFVSRFTPDETDSGASSPGVGSLLHLVRGLFGGRRRGDDSGAQQDS